MHFIAHRLPGIAHTRRTAPNKLPLVTQLLRFDSRFPRGRPPSFRWGALGRSTPGPCIFFITPLISPRDRTSQLCCKIPSFTTEIIILGGKIGPGFLLPNPQALTVLSKRNRSRHRVLCAGTLGVRAASGPLGSAVSPGWPHECYKLGQVCFDH